MSCAIIALDNESILSYRPSNGFSKEAVQITHNWNDLEKILSRSVTFGTKFNMLNSLFDVCLEASSENWDGYSAKAISQKTCNNAIKFIRMLPVDFPIPKIDAESNGGILVEWHRNVGQIFSAIIEDDSQITYAGIFSGNKTYGVEYFENEIPKPILEGIQRVYS
jgi:hypothetical protein